MLFAVATVLCTARCWYDASEQGCYRENPDHFHKFRHEPKLSMHETMARLCDIFLVDGFTRQSIQAVLEKQHGHYESTVRLLTEELSRRAAQGRHDMLVHGAHRSRTRADPPANPFIVSLPATATENPEERRPAAQGSTGRASSAVPQPLRGVRHQDNGGFARAFTAASGATRTRQGTGVGATSDMRRYRAPPAQRPKPSVPSAPKSVVRAPRQLHCPAPGDGPSSPATVGATAEPSWRTTAQRTMSGEPGGVCSHSPPRHSRKGETGAGASRAFDTVCTTARTPQHAGVGGGAGAAAQPMSAPPPPATVQRPSTSVVRAPRQPQRLAPGDGPSPLTVGGAVAHGHAPPPASVAAAKRGAQSAASTAVPTTVMTPHASAGVDARRRQAGSRIPAPSTAAGAVAAAIVCAGCDNVIVEDVQHIGLVEENMFKKDPRPNWRPPIHATMAQRYLRTRSVDPKPHPDRKKHRWKQQRLFCVNCANHVGLKCGAKHASQKLHSKSRTVLIKNKHVVVRFTLDDGSTRNCRLPPWRTVREQLSAAHRLIGVVSITVAALATVCRGVSPGARDNSSHVARSFTPEAANTSASASATKAVDKGARGAAAKAARGKATGHGSSAEDGERADGAAKGKAATARTEPTANATNNKASTDTAVEGKAAKGKAAKSKAAKSKAAKSKAVKVKAAKGRAANSAMEMPSWQTCSGRVIKVVNRGCIVKLDNSTAGTQTAQRTAFVQKAGLVVYVRILPYANCCGTYGVGLVLQRRSS